jgi:hypothetical protein
MTPEDVPQELVWAAMEAAFPLLEMPRDAVRLLSAERHTRAALAAVLPQYQEWVRTYVANDLMIAAERYYPHNAAWNQSLHQAAEIADLGLTAYDEEQNA